jgi:hypothetical protein
MSLNWEPGKFKAELVKQLVANGEIAGKFVEEEARRRLLDIQDPEWGAGYRAEVVARLLTSTVEQDGNEVVITVGVAEGSGGRHHGFYIELGSSTAPAHPFLRPAVFENGPQIVALLEGK